MRAFLTVLLQCSLSMTLVTLAYAVVLPLLSKRYTAKWRYLIWLVIAVGWIIPFRPQFDLFPVQETPIPMNPGPLIPPAGGFLPPAVTAAGEAVSALTAVPFWWAPAAIWAAGAAGILLYHALRHIRFMSMVRRWSEPVTDLESLGILDDLKSELNIKAPIKLSVCQSITSPVLVGLFRPAILLPPVRIPEEKLSLILKHELVHFKRHDLWYKMLVLAAEILHWFNPVIYLMARSTATQCEISCDALVLDGADSQQRRQYGEMILDVVRNNAKLTTAFSTGFYGGKQSMKNRISAIMDSKKKKAGLMVLCVVLVAVITAGAALAANQKPSDSSASESDKQEVVSLVEGFGGALKMVSLTAPTEIAAKSIEEQYAQYITPELLAAWKADPQSAPGRRVSSPWPDRIEIKEITPSGKGEYTVSGEIIEITSVEMQSGGAAAKYPVTLQVTKQDNRWLISAVTVQEESVTEPTASE